MNKKVITGTVALASTLLFTGITHNVTYAAEVNHAVSTQTTQGDRPYGGVPPKGMTNAEYTELEQNMPKANEVSPQKYNQLLKNETQKIANKYNTTITTTMGVFKPKPHHNTITK